MRIKTLIIIGLLASLSLSKEIKNPFLIHLSGAVVVEGLGLYSTIATLTDNKTDNITNVAAGVNLGLIALTSTSGTLLKFGKSDNKKGIYIAHRILAYTLDGAALWFAIQNQIDSSVPTYRKAIGWTYFGGTAFQIIGATILF